MKTCSHCKTEKDDLEFRLRRETRGNRGGGKLLYLNNVCRACDATITNKSYNKRKHDPEWLKKWNEQSTKYYHSNKEKCTAKAKDYRSKSKNKRKAYDLAHKDKIKAQHSLVAKRWLAYQRDNLTDVYCTALIRSQNGGKERCKNITPEMIEQKRFAIKLKRQINEIRKANASGSNARIDSVLSGTNIYRNNTPQHASNNW